MRVRPAQASDIDAVRAFTTGTFEWGDYVPDRFEGWLGREDSTVLVATDEDDSPIGLARVLMVSDREAWIHAARVHPDHRRRGIGSTLNEALCDWAGSHGAMVARLMTEDWNEAAQGQVEQSGYRRVSTWSWPMRDLGRGAEDAAARGDAHRPGHQRRAEGPGGGATGLRLAGGDRSGMDRVVEL